MGTHFFTASRQIQKNKDQGLTPYIHALSYDDSIITNRGRLLPKWRHFYRMSRKPELDHTQGVPRKTLELHRSEPRCVGDFGSVSS